MGLSKCIVGWQLILTYLLLILVNESQQLSLPSYIKRCPSQPRDKLEKCAVESAAVAIPRIVKGDRKYNVPSFDPLRLPSADLQAGPNFDLKFTDVIFDGVQKSKLDKISIDLENKDIRMYGHIPLLTLTGPYKLKASIMVMQLEGEGAANITLVNVVLEIKILYHLENRDGKDYFTVTEFDTNYKLDGATFDLSNLLGGQKDLGAHMNQLINDNWEVICNDMYEPMRKLFSTVLRQIAEGYLGSVPFDELFEQ